MPVAPNSLLKKSSPTSASVSCATRTKWPCSLTNEAALKYVIAHSFFMHLNPITHCGHANVNLLNPLQNQSWCVLACAFCAVLYVEASYV
jgi:hypothetical protein